MGLNVRSRWSRVFLGTLGVLAVLALAAPSAEARFKVKISSTPKPHATPTVSKPHTAAPKPDAPKAPTGIETASRVSVQVASRAPDNRGFFRRVWDWLLGRKPVPAPQAPPQAVATAPTAPATPGVVMPVVPVRMAAPLPPGVQPPGLEPEKDKQRAGGMDERLQKLSARIETETRTKQTAAGSGLSSAQGQPALRPSGYILHLTNGRSIRVAYYEERGDQVVIPQMQGSYGLHKSLIARIEPQGTEAEVGGLGGGRR